MMWLKFKGLSSRDQRTTLALTFGGAILLTINWLTFIYVVNHVNVKSASFAYLICPVITAVLGFVLIKEKNIDVTMDCRWIVCIQLCVGWN